MSDSRVVTMVRDNTVIRRMTTPSIEEHRHCAEIKKIAHRTVHAGAILEPGWSMFDQQPNERQGSVAAFSAPPELGIRHARLGGHSS